MTRPRGNARADQRVPPDASSELHHCGRFPRASAFYVRTHANQYICTRAEIPVDGWSGLLTSKVSSSAEGCYGRHYKREVHSKRVVSFVDNSLDNPLARLQISPTHFDPFETWQARPSVDGVRKNAQQLGCASAYVGGGSPFSVCCREHDLWASERHIPRAQCPHS